MNPSRFNVRSSKQLVNGSFGGHVQISIKEFARTMKREKETAKPHQHPNPLTDETEDDGQQDQ
jgi:hypothetical protein